MAGRPNNFKKPPPKQREYLNGGGRKPKACLQPKDQLPQQKIKKAPFPILSLPLEVIHGQILHWLNRMKDVAAFARASKQCRELCLNNILWKGFFFRDFSPQHLAKSFGTRRGQLKMINRFELPWKDYYYFMCSKGGNPDLDWEFLRKMKENEREQHVKDILSLTDPRFHQIEWKSTVEELSVQHDFNNPWNPKVVAQTYFNDGTPLKVISPECSYQSWFRTLSGDVLLTKGSVVSAKPLLIATSTTHVPPMTVKETPTLLDIKWSGWLLAIMIFLLPLIYKISNWLFPSWVDPDGPQNITVPVIHSTTRGFFNTTSKEWTYPNSNVTQEIPSEFYLNHFYLFVLGIERYIWAYLSVKAFSLNWKYYRAGEMPNLFLAFPPFPWPFLWVQRLNNYICGEMFLFFYVLGGVFQVIFPGSFKTDLARFVLSGLLLAMALRFRVRTPDAAGIACAAYTAYFLLLNLHLVWYGALKHVIFGLMVAGFFNFVIPPIVRHDARKQDIGTLIFTLILAFFFGTYWILWVILKWFLYSLPLFFVALTLVLMHDVHKIY